MLITCPSHFFNILFLLYLRIVRRVRAVRFLYCLDKRINVGDIRIVIHLRLFCFHRHHGFFHTLHTLQCRLHR